MRKIREVKAELEKNTELQQKLKAEMGSNNDRSTVSAARIPTERLSLERHQRRCR